MQERLRISLELIVDAIDRIDKHVGSSGEVIFVDNTKLDACLMQLVHIGELAGRIQKSFPTFVLPNNIPLSRVVGLRNIIAHDYLGINKHVILRIIEKNLPELKEAIQSVL